MKPLLYIGHGLTHAAQDFVEDMQLFRDSLADRYELLDFVGVVHGTAESVYAVDSHNVLTCDAFIAECTHPSLGVGIELQIAANTTKPVLILHKRDTKVSRMALGMPNPKQEVVAYDTVEEAREAVHSFVKKYAPDCASA
ncbi:MAG TPA: hypothetical protein PK765_04905 [bacterium]|nr:hypothetical protein [bacterium]